MAMTEGLTSSASGSVSLKPCISCHQQKALSEFYPHPHTSDGTINICKECHKALVFHRAREDHLSAQPPGLDRLRRQGRGARGPQAG